MIAVTDRMMVEFLFGFWLLTVLLGVVFIIGIPGIGRKIDRPPWSCLLFLYYFLFPCTIIKLFHLTEHGVFDKVLFTIGG